MSLSGKPKIGIVGVGYLGGRLNIGLTTKNLRLSFTINI